MIPKRSFMVITIDGRSVVNVGALGRKILFEHRNLNWKSIEYNCAISTFHALTFDVMLFRFPHSLDP